LSILVALFFVCHGSAENIGVTLRLARVLAGEGNHAAAAIEFRRLALAEELTEDRAGYFWSAAHQYWKSGEYDLTRKMLDSAEDADSSVLSAAILLRAEAALSAGKEAEAEFYCQSMLRSKNSPSDYRRTAARQLARATLAKTGTLEDKTFLEESEDGEIIRAIARYEDGHDKSPRLGGLLGLVPGLGYAYAGEYANALRSLLLNGLFIFAMVDTAQNDHWGGFAALTFFEVTWYTGSIYGGIDSTHRYNRERLNRCLKPLEERGSFSPDFSKLPALSLKFPF